MSTNEELPPQAKPRASPLDFRNTDLVSRLLAATPPYLYNMPIVPNSYFFSEMLRSFVQAKTENQNRLPGTLHHRRTRKRSWTQTRAEYYQRDSPKSDKSDVTDYSPQPLSPEKMSYESKRTEKPLELTMAKTPMHNSMKLNDADMKMPVTPTSSPYSMEKQDLPVITQTNHMPMMFPSVPQNLSQDPNHPNLMLPPPPPLWYPPLYPPPYGFDPLHFFIDLRVSGHIYDRKNGKDGLSSATADGTVPVSHAQSNLSPDRNTEDKFQILDTNKDGFKQSKHTSAFRVPIPSGSKNLPMNLSSNKYSSHEFDIKESKSMKFDVKSMGFEKTYNKTSTNYIMTNIGKIYKNLVTYKLEPMDHKFSESSVSADTAKVVSDECKEETEEEKEKRVKDLRALIGLELVVDYMNHAKPRQANHSEESSTDVESAGSPSLEVVACSDERQGI